MTLIKFKPGRDLMMDSVFPSQMMNMFDSFLADPNKKPRNGFFSPRTDVVEKENQFEVHMSLPGLKKEEITIDVNADVLTISGERKFNNENTKDKYHLSESFYGTFSRSFTLPENADKTNISAAFTDGILKLEIPKVELKDNKTSIKIK